MLETSVIAFLPSLKCKLRKQICFLVFTAVSSAFRTDSATQQPHNKYLEREREKQREKDRKKNRRKKGKRISHSQPVVT